MPLISAKMERWRIDLEQVAISRLGLGGGDGFGRLVDIVIPNNFPVRNQISRSRHSFIVGSGQHIICCGFHHLGLAKKPACRFCQLLDIGIRFFGNFIHLGKPKPIAISTIGISYILLRRHRHTICFSDNIYCRIYQPQNVKNSKTKAAFIPHSLRDGTAPVAPNPKTRQNPGPLAPARP